MEHINKIIQDILKKENADLDTLYNDIDANSKDSKTNVLEQVIISCINNKRKGVELLKVLFEYKNMEIRILRKITDKWIIMKETMFSSVSVNIFIFLFEKLQYITGEETCLILLIANAINYDEGRLEKLKYLINHDDLRWFLTANNFCHLRQLLLSSYNIRFEKFLCVLHSKFMDNNLLETINASGKNINLWKNYLEHYFRYQIDTSLKQSRIIDMFKIKKNYTINTINRHIYKDKSYQIYSKIDYEYEIMYLIKTGFVKREMFVNPVGNLQWWFCDGLMYGTTRIVDLLSKYNLLTEEECVDFCKKIHYKKFLVVIKLFSLVITKKKENIYNTSLMRLLSNKGRVYNCRPQLTADKILN